MSLKGFHIVFVTVSSLLCLFLALWSFILTDESSAMIRALGIVGLLGLLLMPLYGVYFYRKLTRNAI
jgi:hypothetical protein